MITTRSQDREAELRPLMIAGCHGNQQAYAALLSEVAKLLRGFFRKRMLSVPDDVEDVVQEVLIAIHNQRHTYDAGQPLTAWVFGIARFKLADFYRRRGAQGGDHLDIDDAAEWLATEDHDAHEARRDVGSLLDELPPKQRDAIRCVKIDGLSIAEAAAHTGQSESSVKVGIHRGLKALAARMRAAS